MQYDKLDSKWCAFPSFPAERLEDQGGDNLGDVQYHNKQGSILSAREPADERENLKVIEPACEPASEDGRDECIKPARKLARSSGDGAWCWAAAR